MKFQHLSLAKTILWHDDAQSAIDSQIIEGKNIRIAELVGGCVCCSLTGEFEAAVNELVRQGVVSREVGSNFLTRRSAGGASKYGKG